MAIEKTRTFSRGCISRGWAGRCRPFCRGAGPDQLHIKSLIEAAEGPEAVEEIIVATNPTAEGRGQRRFYICRKLLKPLGSGGLRPDWRGDSRGEAGF